MRNLCRDGRRAVVLAAAGIMAAGLLAACGTAGPGGNSAGLTRASGSHPGSRDGALSLARQLLSQLVLPSGAGPARVSALPGPLRRPSLFVPGPDSADAHRLFTLAQPATAVHDFLLAHVPAGMRLQIKGQGS